MNGPQRPVEEWQVYRLDIGHSAAVVHVHASIGTHTPQHAPETEDTCPGGQTGVGARQRTVRASQDVAQGPIRITDVPAEFALQVLEYVIPSHPQSGAYSSVHALGIRLHVPC